MACRRRKFATFSRESCQARSKAPGSGPGLVGVRRFESGLSHHRFITINLLKSGFDYRLSHPSSDQTTRQRRTSLRRSIQAVRPPACRGQRRNPAPGQNRALLVLLCQPLNPERLPLWIRAPSLQSRSASCMPTTNRSRSRLPGRSGPRSRNWRGSATSSCSGGATRLIPRSAGTRRSAKKPYTKGPETIGIFATRSPARPNPIALSVAPVIDIDIAPGIIRVAYIDADDATPVLDIKPYFPATERVRDVSVPAWSSH